MIFDKARSLEFLQAVYCNDQLPLQTRMRAAIAALPFESPRLMVTAQVNEQSFAEVLERRLKRIEQIKNGKVINGEKVIEAPAIEAKPILPRLNDRRFRRM